jgi:hypothetical protein
MVSFLGFPTRPLYARDSLAYYMLCSCHCPAALHCNNTLVVVAADIVAAVVMLLDEVSVAEHLSTVLDISWFLCPSGGNTDSTHLVHETTSYI